MIYLFFFTLPKRSLNAPFRFRNFSITNNPIKAAKRLLFIRDYKHFHGLWHWKQICLQVFPVLVMRMVYIHVSSVCSNAASETEFICFLPTCLRFNLAKLITSSPTLNATPIKKIIMARCFNALIVCTSNRRKEEDLFLLLNIWGFLSLMFLSLLQCRKSSL